MSERRKLLTVEYHSDDDTGIYKIGEIDFGICGELQTYLESFGFEGKKEIVQVLGYLIYEVEKRWHEINDKNMTQGMVG